jgi:hypothetical protein
MWTTACEFACRTEPDDDRRSCGRDLYPAGLRLEPDILHLISLGSELRRILDTQGI